MRNIWVNEAFVEQLDDMLRRRKRERSDELFYYGRVVLVDTLLKVKDGDYVLDIGCGGGDTIKRYENRCFVVGIDISRKMCKEAKKNISRGEIVIASMEHLPFKDGVMDKVVAVYSIVYSPHKRKIMKEISRVLREKGELVVYDPNRISIRTLIRRLLCIKFSISGEKDNPKYIYHKIVTKQALSYFDFRNPGYEVNPNLVYWCGIFSIHTFLPSKIFSLMDKLGYKKWGNVPILKFFSDFLILKFVKDREKENRKEGRKEENVF